MKRITKKEQEAAKTIRAAAQKALDGGYYLDTRRVKSWDGAVVFKLITRLGGYHLCGVWEKLRGFRNIFRLGCASHRYRRPLRSMRILTRNKSGS